MDILLSVHDVMPETLDDVDAVLAHLNRLGHPRALLLVVPGRDWSEAGLARLRDYARLGHELAGHGWHHETRVRKPLHRLHAALISRNVAEHLDLDAAGIEQLIKDCHRWFADHDLPAPRQYVAPAWAMGAIGTTALGRCPFQSYESLVGIYHRDDERFRAIPLVGFEADAAWRVPILRALNAVNMALARRLGRLRVAVHPRDIALPMRDDIDRVLTGG